MDGPFLVVEMDDDDDDDADAIVCGGDRGRGGDEVVDGPFLVLEDVTIEDVANPVCGGERGRGGEEQLVLTYEDADAGAEAVAGSLVFCGGKRGLGGEIGRRGESFLGGERGLRGVGDDTDGGGLGGDVVDSR